MLLSGTDRRRQLITAGVGTVLTLVMGLVLFVGFRIATEMRVNIAALQTASTLQTYPDDITQQLASLRDRLEARAYSGQALQDLRATVRRFDRQLKELNATGYVHSAELTRALQLWREYGPVIEPVVSFNGQPYIDSDISGSTPSRDGRTPYAEVKRAAPCAAVYRRAGRAGPGGRGHLVPVHPCAPRARRARGAGADPRHPHDSARGLLPARRRVPHRLRVVGGADAHVRPQG